MLYFITSKPNYPDYIDHELNENKETEQCHPSGISLIINIFTFGRFFCEFVNSSNHIKTHLHDKSCPMHWFCCHFYFVIHIIDMKHGAQIFEIKVNLCT